MTVTNSSDPTYAMGRSKSENETTPPKLTAGELAERIRAGDLSSQEVVEAHIRRIEAVNPSLNAVVVPLFEQARSGAALADSRLETGQPLGPLHGVPITAKESIHVAGTASTCCFARRTPIRR
jgi:fatty acid amide hydrolase